MTVDPITTTETALWLVNLAKKEGWLDKLRDLLREKHWLPVLGASGVGKTNLIQSLTTELPDAIDSLDRTAHHKEHAIRIAGEPFRLVDTAGQAHHRSDRIAVLLEHIGRGRGIVANVVCYGYHEHSRSSIAEIGSAVQENVVNPEWLRFHRDVEIAALREWVDTFGVGRFENVSAMISIVTKADLWWTARDEVFDHYESGPYFAALGSLQSVPHLVMEYSAVSHRFYGSAPLDGAFDSFDRKRARQRLLRELVSVAG